MKSIHLIIVLAALSLLMSPAGALAEQPGTGVLKVLTKGSEDVEVPLKHTSVEAKIAGFVARVTVTQTFVNPFKNPIEAVYVFPMPHEAAVDDMTMKIGKRVIKGVIKKREEARKIYEQAKKEGKTASLLDQERSNIFTQRVANILPGDNIEIQISYVEVLEYEEGEYEFVFPMVVGPRYIPGHAVGKSGGGWAPDTSRVPDASKITPPVLKPGQRSGHDIDLTVRLDAGIPFYHLRSTSHEINVKTKGQQKATVTLKAFDTIPNKDLILRYKVLGDAPEFGSLTYTKDGQGHFLLALAPKANYSKKEIGLREIFFVVDSSGSQRGDPLVKSKEAVKRALKGLRPSDTFQVYDFNDIVTSMSPSTVPATPTNIRDALKFVDQIQARGGTRMLPVIQTALNLPPDPKRLRIVFMTTDGFIGNEVEIIKEIHDSLGDARLFSLGVGSSVNRYLLDRMAQEGKGFVQFVRQDEPTKEVVENFHKRIATPVMTDIEIDWGGLRVKDVYPERVPDLFAGRPLVIHGRFDKPGEGTVRLLGKLGKKSGEISAEVKFPAKDGGYDSLGTLWARAKIEKLMAEIERGRGGNELVEQVTNIGLEYRLMTKYTSFVAVEEKVRNVGGKQQTVQVPVEMPEGVSYEGVFGEEMEVTRQMMHSKSVGGSASGAIMAMSNAPAFAPKSAMKKSRSGLGASADLMDVPESTMSGEKHSRIPRLDPVAFLGISNEAPYRQALQQNFGKAIGKKLDGIKWPKGKQMMVRLVLNANGGVKKVEFVKDDTGNAKIKAIIAKALKSLKFKAPGREAALVFFLRF